MKEKEESKKEKYRTKRKYKKKKKREEEREFRLHNYILSHEHTFAMTQQDSLVSDVLALWL